MLEEIIILILENFRKILGAFLGFIIAILFLIFGFFSTVFIILLTLVGYILSDNQHVKRHLNNILERFRS